jgi:L-malate glycosyltransferase
VKIGIICYASVGGSGVVATELALALADRGHAVHLVSADLPFRWRWGTPGLSFERVETPSYPLFREPQYLIALTNTLVRVSRMHKLDILHAHYAVPHATAAYLAHQILSADNGSTPPRTVTTLHGTDITLVGSDASYADVVGFSIERSHGITAVSESLKRDTESSLAIRSEIRVIPNFLDGTVWTRRPDPSLRARLSAGSCAVIVHVSNFRPVKRIGMVLDIFGMIHARVPGRLVMIGDGPDRPAAERQAAAMGLSNHVEFVGEQQDLVPWLSTADVFLLPSSQESFGLAALEAMACGVPVVASRVGGMPEVIVDGKTGFVCDPSDAGVMAERAIELLLDASRREAMAREAAADVRARFSADAVVPRYEAFYEEVLTRGLSPFAKRD